MNCIRFSCDRVLAAGVGSPRQSAQCIFLFPTWQIVSRARGGWGTNSHKIGFLGAYAQGRTAMGDTRATSTRHGAIGGLGLPAEIAQNPDNVGLEITNGRRLGLRPIIFYTAALDKHPADLLKRRSGHGPPVSPWPDLQLGHLKIG